MTDEAQEIDAHAEIGVRNSQAEGIGRVVALADGVVAWNNLGRNVVFAGADCTPLGVFGDSMFDDDEPSQFDLDVHAILQPDGLDVVLVVNHFGTVRAFDASFAPVWTRQFVGDVERVIVVGNRLVGSAPREAREPGLLVSEPIAPGDGRFDVSHEREELGLVTALAPVGEGGVAVGGERRVVLAAVADGRVAAPFWETDVPFQPAYLEARGGLVWAAGSGTGALDDYDWEAQHGGGFAAFDARDGRLVVAGVFEEGLAWGNGGVALALVGDLLCGVGRRGELHFFDTRDGSHVGTRKPITDHSLGIAHCAAAGDTLLVGFNRGGYRLWALPIGSPRGKRAGVR